MTRRALQLLAAAALIFTLWSITDSPDQESPEWVPATEAVVTTSAAPSTTTSSTTTTSTTTTTSPVVPMTSPPTVRSGDCGGWRDVVAAHFPGEVDRACGVFIGCESKGDPNAVSPTNDHGLAQIHAGSAGFPGGWVDEFERVTGVPFYDGVYDPNLNLQFAAWLRAESGWSAWACAA